MNDKNDIQNDNDGIEFVASLRGEPFSHMSIGETEANGRKFRVTKNDIDRVIADIDLIISKLKEMEMKMKMRDEE